MAEEPHNRLFPGSAMVGYGYLVNELHAGNSYYAKYEAACAALARCNINVDQGSQRNRLVTNGWV